MLEIGLQVSFQKLSEVRDLTAVFTSGVLPRRVTYASKPRGPTRKHRAAKRSTRRARAEVWVTWAPGSRGHVITGRERTRGVSCAGKGVLSVGWCEMGEVGEGVLTSFPLSQFCPGSFTREREPSMKRNRGNESKSGD